MRPFFKIILICQDMSLDFSNELFHSKISCSCVCADGFEATNLISKNRSKKYKGFQGERFVRTPVTIQLQFYVPISIHKIELTPYIGRQCCKIMDLWVSSICSTTNRTEVENITFNVNDDQYRKAATVNMSEPSKIVFLNRGYRQHPKLDARDNNEQSKLEYTNGNLSSVSSIRIKVRQMLSGSIPSLTDLQIWGRPARNCPKELYQEVMQIYRNLTDNSDSNRCISMYNSSENLASEKALPTESSIQNFDLETKNTSDSNEIQPTEIRSLNCHSSKTTYSDNTDNYPQEFLDPLTYMPMRAPVLLPSGHTVDRSTLDKHVKSQFEMGNVPSDPFTGIPFTEACKPLPNVELKIRMDNYFLKKARLKDCNENQIGSCSEKVYPNTQSQKTQNSKNTAQMGDFQCLQSDNGRLIRPGHTDAKVNFEIRSTAKHKLEPDTSSRSIKKPKRENSSEVISDHSSTLSFSLDTSLANLNKHRTEKKRKIAVNSSESIISDLYCSKCRKYLSSSVTQYRLSCSHIVCSSCLKKPGSNTVNSITCTVCNSICPSRDIERVHS